MKKVISILLSAGMINFVYAHKISSPNANLERYKIDIARTLDTNPGQIDFDMSTLCPQKQQKKDNNTFVVNCKNKPYVVRVFGLNDSEKKRDSEIQVVKFASDANVGPHFIGAPKNQEFYITEFIPHTLQYFSLNDALLLKIGKTLQKLHHLTLTKKGKSHIARIQRLFRFGQKKKIAYPVGFYESIQDYVKNSEKLKIKTGFCHGNLNMSNIRLRDDNSVVFLNWKGSGSNNVYEDIGYFIASNALTDKQIHVFLEGYLERPATT